MYSKKELESYLDQVSNAMMHLKNDSFQEKYPIGLIDINLWEWPQGVGLYGLYKYYLLSKKQGVLDFLCHWFDSRLAEGLPERNVNTTAPMLTMIGVYELTGKEEYRALCEDWSNWVMNGLLRTGGDRAFQHMITGDPNDGQILIDTLFMTVLFLAKAGMIFQRPEYVEEAKRQFLIHIKYLYDTSCGLYFHGFDFKGMHHYGGVHWARGNSWYTCGIVDFLDMVPMEAETGLREYFLDTLRAQVAALVPYQTESGLWRTVIDDEDSYVETSGTAAFAYGILKGIRCGYLPKSDYEMGMRALRGVIGQIDAEGVVQNVSYGTPVGNDAQFYKDIPVCPMTYGQALTLLLLAEALNHMGQE